MLCHWATGNWVVNQGGFAPVALFEDFQEIETLLALSCGRPNEQLDSQAFRSDVGSDRRRGPWRGPRTGVAYENRGRNDRT